MAETHAPHAADEHAAEDEDGHDDHGRGADSALGPINVPAWGAAAGGVLLGLLVVLALIQALS